MKELNVIEPAGMTQEVEEFARLARALGHPHRVNILRFLAAQNACFCGRIVDLLPIAQSTVSQHLKKLKEAGWIEGEIDSPRVCYCINPATAERFLFLLNKLFPQSADVNESD